MEKIIVCSADEAEAKVQVLLEDGWTVKHCEAETVSSNGQYYSRCNGKMVFVLMKPGSYEVKGHWPPPPSPPQDREIREGKEPPKP